MTKKDHALNALILRCEHLANKNFTESVKAKGKARKELLLDRSQVYVWIAMQLERIVR